MAALAFSCSTDGSRETGRVAFESVESSASYRLLNSAREYGSDEDIVYSDSVNMLLPTCLYGHDVAPLRDSIMKLAFDTVGSDISSVLDGYMQHTISQFGYPTERADSLPAGHTADGFNNIEGSVVNLTSELLVYCVSTDDYQPRAAHGMSTRFYLNYDLRSDKVLSASDLFKPELTDSLVAAIQTQADALEQVIGPTTITALPAGDNFMLAPSGEIIFVYQPYEVASYAQGMIRVSFYPYELVDYMTPFAVSLFRLTDLG